jgi:excisionase family DNA binding protein
MTNPFLSPKELAQAIGVSESSLKRWADDGKLVVSRTAGGHRRIALQEAVRFVRAGGHPLRDAGVLGLEAGVAPEGEDELGEQLYSALHAGDPVVSRALIVGAFLRGRTLASLCDGPIRTALERIGALWQRGDVGIAIERLATSICQALIAQLRALLPEPAVDAPLCLGGCLAGDAHLLPSSMASTTLTESGWQARDLGGDISATVLAAAIGRHPPHLVWRSISVSADATGTVRDLRTLAHDLGRIPLVLCGSAVAGLNLGEVANLHTVGSMAELASFARGVACTVRRRAR